MSNRVLFIAAVLAIVLIGNVVWDFIAPSDQGAMTPSIAVRPLVRFGPDNDAEHVASTLTRMTVDSLDRQLDGRVVPENQYREKVQDRDSIAQIMERLEVTTVIEGTVSILDDGVRVSISIVDGKSTTDNRTFVQTGNVDDLESLAEELTASILAIL